KLWPTGLASVGVPLKGKIPPAEHIEPGRAVGRLSDLGWGTRLRALVAPEAADAPIPDDLAAAVVEVLKSWAHGDNKWQQRPAAVVAVGSHRRPELLHSLASHIAKVGRLPLLGTLTSTHRGDAGPRGNSAQRVRALHDAFELPPDLATSLSNLDAPILLVDDLVDSGWTMVLAGRALRQAGAPGVLPLALAVAG
ncbi:MAG TPA: recombinase RecQ, partial [Actinoplanes sp.]|nr:recombinase RecQ [Actinoplanes sp.]